MPHCDVPASRLRTFVKKACSAAQLLPDWHAQLLEPEPGPVRHRFRIPPPTLRIAARPQESSPALTDDDPREYAAVWAERSRALYLYASRTQNSLSPFHHLGFPLSGCG